MSPTSIPTSRLAELVDVLAQQAKLNSTVADALAELSAEFDRIDGELADVRDALLALSNRVEAVTRLSVVAAADRDTPAGIVYCSCEAPIMDVEHDAGCRRCGLPVDFSPRPEGGA